MNIFYVDIFDEYYNWENIKIIGTKHRFLGIYKSDFSKEEFEWSLYELIMHDKNDGISIDTNQIENIYFIDIRLFLGKEDNYSINYIKEYLSNNYEEIDENEIEFKTNLNHNIFLYCKYSDEQSLNDVIDILNQNKITDYQLSIRTHTFERGASDLFQSYLISLFAGATIEGIKYAINVYRTKIDRNLNIAVLDPVKLRNNISTIASINLDDLYIVEFKEKDSKEYIVILRNRYHEFEVICDHDSKVVSFKSRDLRK